MGLSVAHGTYALVTLVVIGTMLFRRGVVLPAWIGTWLVAWLWKGHLVTGLQAVFNANLVAARELFSIFLIIAFMVGLLRSLEDLGADRLMVAPVQRMMVNAHLSYFILAGVTYILSLFFWPTPAVPLIGALLLPPAIRAGLPAIGGAVAISLAGQGMALSSDYVMQVAPMLSAKAAGVSPAAVAERAWILSWITGLVALGWAYFVLRKQMGKTGQTAPGMKLRRNGKEFPLRVKDLTVWGRVFAMLVPLSLLSVMVYMVTSKSGGSSMAGLGGAALIGGVAAILLTASTVAYARIQALDRISDHLVEGFLFAFRTMGPVVPIAGFFFLGSGDYSGEILSAGKDAPSFLFDLVQAGQDLIPDHGVLTTFGILIVGMITGLDGSGFSGLPLTGGLSGALAVPSGMDPVTLAAVGQMGSVWTGGGTIIAWSSLMAVAGFAGVSVMELVRRNFLPVMAGLILSTLVAVWIW
ncbi:hypothetical protein ACFQ49_08450 [Kroppenstedtia eburnea]|uniref:H+/gluconate symporter n=1 Tax=Kroppenstedtia eburnea TaxID=714067 RepID=A0A1N7IL15_9BACL|nr:hypothetical protein [Kroppenstedtia eburnea]EGK14499.1 citrate transporter [Desmospora sp. 8437]QKI81910.1 hypothetical protein GXN75_07800 [Kroppenstedtia eburnea]SIS37671.1 hypothetical protein SAMN05421790_10138 [Kroppenstedtia eburnea]